MRDGDCALHRVRGFVFLVPAPLKYDKKMCVFYVKSIPHVYILGTAGFGGHIHETLEVS